MDESFNSDKQEEKINQSKLDNIEFSSSAIDISNKLTF